MTRVAELPMFATLALPRAMRREFAADYVALLESARLPTGICRYCGCTDHDACIVDDVRCSWIDHHRRLCSACLTAAFAEVHWIRPDLTLPGGDRGFVHVPWTNARLRAYHLGFVVGWFAVSPRREAGRPTYLRPQNRYCLQAWKTGQIAGAAARVHPDYVQHPRGRVAAAAAMAHPQHRLNRDAALLPRPPVLAAYAGRTFDVSQ